MQPITWPGAGFDELSARAVALLNRSGPQRRILGIAGAPAAGKSTLAVQLQNRLAVSHPGRTALVGMDAFHLAQRVLDDRGLAEIKGAPETFDAVGYAELLRRLRSERQTVYAPEFDRGIEDSIAQATPIPAGVGLIITEGNYLLLDREPWRVLREIIDETWLISLDDAPRRQRLVTRHQRFGRDRSAAEARTYGTDERNAQLIVTASSAPDVWITHAVEPVSKS
jgi:pantothenate kinase